MATVSTRHSVPTFLSYASAGHLIWVTGEVSNVQLAFQRNHVGQELISANPSF